MADPVPQIASWQYGSSPALRFPVEDVRTSHAVRIVERERPYRRAAKLDDTGSKSTRWVVTSRFSNRLSEPGLPADPPLYPTLKDQIIATKDEGKTGTLALPTGIVVGARLASAEEHESVDDADACTVTFTFVEDNEDDVDLGALEATSARAGIASLAEQTVFDAERAAAWDLSLADIRGFAADLQGLINAPFDYLNDAAAVAGALASTAVKLESALLNPDDPVREQLLSDPSSSAYARLLERLRDGVAGAEYERGNSRGRIVARVYAGPRSLFGVAEELGVDAPSLFALNPGMADPLNIPAGTPIRVPLGA